MDFGIVCVREHAIVVKGGGDEGSVARFEVKSLRNSEATEPTEVELLLAVRKRAFLAVGAHW